MMVLALPFLHAAHLPVKPGVRGNKFSPLCFAMGKVGIVGTLLINPFKTTPYLFPLCRNDVPSPPASGNDSGLWIRLVDE
jgi:hypothetical protein